MSAFTPPRADLRGGNQSEDSFAISRRIFAPPTTLCLFAVRFEQSRVYSTEGVESAHIDSDQRCSQGPRGSSNVVLGTWVCLEWFVVGRCRPQCEERATLVRILCSDVYVMTEALSAEILLCHEDDPRPSHLTLNIHHRPLRLYNATSFCRENESDTLVRSRNCYSQRLSSISRPPPTTALNKSSRPEIRLCLYVAAGLGVHPWKTCSPGVQSSWIWTICNPLLTNILHLGLQLRVSIRPSQAFRSHNVVPLEINIGPALLRISDRGCHPLDPRVQTWKPLSFQ